MAHFRYTAEKSDGEVYTGVAQARDRFEAYEIIRHEGGRLIAIDEEHAKLLSTRYWNERFSTIKEYDKITFSRNLGAMLSAGLSLARALSVLERQATNARFAKTIEEVSSDVRHGSSLHDALGKFPRVFPRLLIAMVRAGEEGGQLPQSFQIIADQMERMYTLKKKIRGALIYPTIVVCVILGIGALMMTEVVPTLAKTFEEMNAQLPKSTLAIIGISNFLVDHTVSAIALVVGLIVGVYSALKTAAGRRVIEFGLLHMPAIGDMVREANSARTARTLSSLLSSGVDMIAALSIVEDVVQNSFFRTVIAAAKQNIVDGDTLSRAFARYPKIYPPFVGEMMSVGEETGELSEMLKRVSAFYEDEVDRKTKDMSTIIEPLLMVFIGGAVGFFAVSMISPIYQLSTAI